MIEERDITDEGARSSEDPLDLAERDARIREVLQGFREHDCVEPRVRKRKRRVEIDPLDIDPVLRSRGLQRLPVDVGAADAVAFAEVAGEVSVSAPQVEQVFALANPLTEESGPFRLEECFSEPLAARLVAAVMLDVDPLEPIIFRHDVCPLCDVRTVPTGGGSSESEPARSFSRRLGASQVEGRGCGGGATAE